MSIINFAFQYPDSTPIVGATINVRIDGRFGEVGDTILLGLATATTDSEGMASLFLNANIDYHIETWFQGNLLNTALIKQLPEGTFNFTDLIQPQEFTDEN